MKDFQCSSCGQETKPAAHCPHCGATQPQWAEHLAEIERSIAEMKAREAAIAAEQRQIAQKMQAALFQRDILAHAGEDGLNKSTRPHRVLRRRTRRQSGPTTAAGTTQSSKAAAAPPAQGTGPSGRTGTPKTPPGKAGAGRPEADAPGRADTGPADAGRTRTPKAGPDPTAPRRAGTGRNPRVPRQGTVPPPQDPPGRTDAIWLDADDPENPPEASSREVQNIPLGLGALLLGVAAVVFAILAGTSMDALGRLGILLLATVVMLLVPPVLARRGLTSTAETISVVGLLLLPLAGYALWSVDRIGSGGFPGALFVALVFGGTTATALLYARFTGLRAPRFATVLAAQPILPALAYGWVDGAVGWALVLTAVAGLDLWLARSALTVERPVRRDLPEPGRDRRTEGRPETAPEERAEVLGGHQSGRVPRPARTGRPTGPARPVPGLARLTWVLHAVAVVLALALAVTGLLRAATVPVAVGAGAALLLAAALCLAGTLAARRAPLPDVGAGVVTLAVIVASSRIAAVALPGRAVLVIAAVIAVTGLAVRAVPEAARRGPQLAAATALTVCGLVVAFDAVRAGLAPVWAALPAWDADLDRYPRVLADATGAAAWQLPLAALLLTVAAVLALPAQIRREFAVVGVALTALAVPASFGLGWAAAPWPTVLAAVGVGLAGLSARTERSALVHVVTAALLGAVGTGAALARPAVTSIVLLVLCLAGIAAALVPRFRMAPAGAETVTAWAAGGAAFALPGSVAAFVTATVPVDPTPTPASLREMTVPVLAASFLAVCVTLGHAALVQVSHRHVPTPLATGTGLGALVVCAAAFVAPGTTAADLWLAGLVLVATALVVLTPMIDARRPSDVSLDAADLALAAVTTALVATMVRVAAVVTPGGQLVVAAILVLVVAVTARALPQQWRRGPVLGVAVGGVLIGLIAGWSTVRSGLAVLATPGPIWAGDLSGWPMVPAGGAWQAPAALALLGVAAAVLLPPPWKYDVSGAAAVLATIGVPAALGLSWWSPVVVGTMVATCYAMASVAAVDPRAALSRATMAGILGLYAAAAGLPRPWSTALALGAVVLICVTVAAVARVVAAGQVDVEAEGLPPHLAQVGGAAVPDRACSTLIYKTPRKRFW
ncbi:permease, partial [Micromonospora sp. NPDC000207]